MSLIISARRQSKTNTSLSADGTYTVPNGTIIDCIQFTPSIDMPAVKIGLTFGGEEILPSAALTAGQSSLIGTLLLPGTVVYFAGITAAAQIIFFRKQ